MKASLATSKLLLLFIGLLLGSLLGYKFGPIFQKPPILDVAAHQTSDLNAAFDTFINAQRKTLELFKNESYFGENDQAKAEAYRGLLYAIVGSIRTGALLDEDQPRFMRAVDWTSKSGLDNPDNNYYFARINDNTNYLIRGTRGTTSQLIFQIVIGQPGVAGAGPGTNVALLDAQDLIMEKDGSFEILVGPDNPGDAKNWMKTTPGAGTIMARATHSNWQNQRAGFLDIQAINIQPTPPLTSEDMSRRLVAAATHLYDRNATWLGYANKTWEFRTRNEFSKMSQTQGGLPGQYSSFGSWQLNDDEALVISIPESGADYQGIQLGNRWFISLDYETHTSSLTSQQAHKSNDGFYHFVISLNDPGIQNWLDPVGHEQGLIMLRWQGLETLPDALAQPAARLVKLTELQQVLPADTPSFGIDQRQQQVQLRKRAVRERFPG